MKQILLLFLFTLLTFFVTAQNSPVKPFGEVTLEELKISSCPYDSAASAMILFDKGDAEMDVTRGSTFKRHVRIKFFKKDAADVWGTKVVYFPKDGGGFSKFKASTYNLVDGKVVETKISEDALFKGKYDKYTNQARFSLPQIKEGSIIEYTYVVGTADLVGPPEWQFQYEIPVLWSEYTTKIPDYFTFRKDWQGFLAPVIKETKGEFERLVVMNAPAFKAEPFISSEENYISKVRLFVSEIWVPGQQIQQIIKSWGSVAKSVYESELGIQIRGSGYLKKIVDEQTVGLTDPETKITALYDFVKKSVAWNEETDVLPDRQFKEVLEAKIGASSEINGLLIALLKKADIDAEPLLLRTRDEGIIKPFLPIFRQFNDVICRVKIGDKILLLDATHQELPQHALPERCINGQGMVVMKETFEWIDLVSPKSRRSTTADLVLNEEGGLTGKITISRDGIYGANMRKAYKKNGEETYLKSLADSKTWEINKSVFENILETKSPAKETHELVIPNYGQSTGSIIYINPIVVGRMEQNPFKLENREYPVDFGSPFDEVFLAKIIIPEDYIIEELPKSKIMVLPDGGGKYSYSITAMNNSLNIVSQFMINRSWFDPEEYLHVREFYTQVVAKQAELIVLKKK